jgi:hypothetical protein
MNKLQIAVKSFLNPLPNPKNEVKKYRSGLSLSHLTNPQLELLISIVIKEAEKSRQFGLFIRPEDLESEINFWVAHVNSLDPNINPNLISHSTYRKIWNLYSEYREKYFAEANLYYFNLINNSKPRITFSRQAFLCHQEAVQAKVLDSVVNGCFK